MQFTKACELESYTHAYTSETIYWKLHQLCWDRNIPLAKRYLWIWIVKADIWWNQASLENEYCFDETCKSSR